MKVIDFNVPFSKSALSFLRCVASRKNWRGLQCSAWRTWRSKSRETMNTKSALMDNPIILRNLFQRHLNSTRFPFCFPREISFFSVESFPVQKISSFCFMKLEMPPIRASSLRKSDVGLSSESDSPALRLPNTTLLRWD